MGDKFQKQRFEIKYRISEYKAQEIRHFVSQYLALDPYGATQPDISYPVHSLYIDSAAMKTFHDTINGNRNRYKLRIRFYENGNEKPVYFEIKRRFDKVIAKKRAKVHRKYVADLLSGQMPVMEHLVEQTPDNLEALEHFCFLVNQIQARPKIHVAYRREAYELEDSNAVRLTFDREVVSESESGYELQTQLSNPVSVFGKEVVLELKFTNRYPIWLQELTQLFHLRQESAAKYVDGVIRLGPKRLMTA
jgi:SPX domain protein involved in polyphosphate accumulation